MKNFLKKNWFLILLAMLATALGLFWAYSRLPKREVPTPVPQAIETPSSRFSEKPEGVTYTIVVPAPQLPDRMDVFTLERFSKDSLPLYLQALASEFGIPISSPSQAPRDDLLVWDGPTFSLALNLPSGSFDLYKGSQKVAPSFSLGSARQYAIDKAKELGLVRDVAVVDVGSFVVAGVHLEEAPPGNAEVFIVKVQASINGFPLVSVGQSQNHVEFRLTKGGEITKIGYNMPVPKASMGSFRLKSWDRVVAQLQGGEAQTISIKDAEGNTAAPLSAQPLTRATITKSYLAYFDSGESQTTLQPVFVFEGTGTTTTGEARIFALYVSALETGL